MNTRYTTAEVADQAAVQAEIRARRQLLDGLASVFGREWLRLTAAEQDLILRDCTEEGGVSDLVAYRKAIGTGNLASYARVMAVRFNRQDGQE